LEQRSKRVKMVLMAARTQRTERRADALSRERAAGVLATILADLGRR
jgi:hypothetical protein